MCVTNKMVQSHLSSVIQASKAHLTTPVTCQSNKEICVLDMASFYSGQPQKIQDFVEQLRWECHNVGLFYVKNHGVSEDLCDSMLDLCRCFFQLPLEQKMAMDYRHSPHFRGFMQLGVENTAGLTDHREQIEFGPEEEEKFEIVDGKRNHFLYPLYKRLQGPNQWPPTSILPNFRPTIEEFMKRMSKFSMHLMSALALSLGLRRDYFLSTFGQRPFYQMKITRYPPSRPKDRDEVMYGVGPHSDTGYLSLLLQDNVGGLQAKLADGNWVDVQPKRGTFVVNLGEMLQIATQGYFRATVHRVITFGSDSSRYSVPFFFNPSLDAEIKPIDCSAVLRTEGSLQPKVCPEATHGGQNKILPVFGNNTFKSYARSHPEVVKRFHSDIIDEDGTTIFLKDEASHSYRL